MLESALALGALLGASYVKSVERRSRHLLRHLQQSQRGMSGHLHRWDAELGYATVAGAVGFDYFPVGPEVPICIDEFGFRVPESGRSDRVEAGLLTLGCSFTFGQACRAEDTYAYQLGARLGLAVANAGVCGYGLQHTLLQARRWIPQIRPKVVVAQLAPWMQQRAEQPFAPSQFGRLTCPYFVGNPPQLRPPLFRSQVFEVPVWEFRQRSRGFFQKVGWPLFWHEDRAYLARRLQGMPARTAQTGPAGQQQRAAQGEITAKQILIAKHGIDRLVIPRDRGEKRRRHPRILRKPHRRHRDRPGAQRKRQLRLRAAPR